MSSGVKVARHVSPLYRSPLTSVDRLIVPYPRPRRIPRDHLHNRVAGSFALAAPVAPLAYTVQRRLHGKLAAPLASLLFVCRRRRLRFVGKHSRVAGRLSDPN